MIYSPNLNIIIKVIDKIAGRLARDFGEIENLQNNPASAIKFANASYQRIKESLADNLSKLHPDYNIEFLDGQTIINNKTAKYNYIIHPIDGLINLSRAIPYFSTVIALEYINNDKKKVIAVVINDIINNQLFFCEKGGRAFLNSRRIRVSANNSNDNILCSAANKKLLQHPLINKAKFNFRLENSLTLDIANLACGRLDLYLANNNQDKLLNLALLLLKEAGGIISEKEDILILSNGKVRLDNRHVP